jgi:hypothetical protein
VLARKIIFYIELTSAAKAGKILLYLHEEPNEPTKEGPLSYVLQESPFATVSRGHPSLVLSGCTVYSLVQILYFLLTCFKNVKI